MSCQLIAGPNVSIWLLSSALKMALASLLWNLPLLPEHRPCFVCTETLTLTWTSQPSQETFNWLMIVDVQGTAIYWDNTKILYSSQPLYTKHLKLFLPLFMLPQYSHLLSLKQKNRHKSSMASRCGVLSFLPYHFPTWIHYVFSTVPSRPPCGHFVMMYSHGKVPKANYLFYVMWDCKASQGRPFVIKRSQRLRLSIPLQVSLE